MLKQDRLLSEEEDRRRAAGGGGALRSSVVARDRPLQRPTTPSPGDDGVVGMERRVIKDDVISRGAVATGSLQSGSSHGEHGP